MSADTRTLQEVVRDALRSLSVDAGLELQTWAVVEALGKRLHRDEGQDVCIPHLIMECGELRFLSCSVTGAMERRIAESDAKASIEQNLFDFASGLVRSQAALITGGGAP